MKRIATFSILIITGYILLSGNRIPSYSLNQDMNFELWKKEEIEKANTAKDCKFMTEEERKVVFYVNLARINPKLFSETLLNEFVAENTIKRTSYLSSLYSDLKKTKEMEPLIVDSNLYLLAKEYAKTHGAKGQVGHINFSKRMSNYSFAGENCHYGSVDALEIVMDLLIDEDVSGYGHRKNILNATFKLIGTSIQPHKVYGNCCVMDFAGSVSSISKMNTSTPKKSEKKKSFIRF